MSHKICGVHKSILIIYGINYKNTPISWREIVYRELERLRLSNALNGLRFGRARAFITTCHRIEVVSLMPPDDKGAAVEGTRANFLGPDHYIRMGRDAVAHILRLAAGLESAVPFENQIAKQVSEAEVSGEGRCSSILRGMLISAADLARRIRSLIGAPYRSLGMLAGELALDRLGDGSRVLLIGSGTMVRDVGSVLRSSGRNLRVYVLTDRKALDGPLSDASRLSYEEICRSEREVQGFEAVISATKRSLNNEYLEKIFAGRYPQLVIDLSFPRSLDPLYVSERSEEYLDVDTLGMIAEKKYSLTEEELITANSIVNASVEVIYRHVASEVLAEEVVREIRLNAGRIVEEEARNALNYLDSGVDPAFVVRKSLERLVNRMLHATCESTRSMAEGGVDERLLMFLKDAFVGGDSR
ncbi:Glutamyl-tRNA reductase [Candidatus Calditenuaceae archaeon HR02]|nr:Glutamyl-tRNA reductase [Candidatus Calditenuaceae archaeon HR02]